MVGARKTNRCDQCRQRKIKCDESWPQCLQCYRSNRECSGPPQRHQFVEADDSGQSDSARSVERRTASSSTTHRASVMLELGRTTSIGGLFHKMQLVPHGEMPTRGISLLGLPNQRAYQSKEEIRIPAHMQATNVDDLARALTTSLQIHAPEINLGLLGPFMQYVAPRLGQSRALDDAVEFCLTSHANLLRNPRNGSWLDPGSYGAALQSLQAALNNPAQVFAAETVCASTILQSIDMACNITGEEGARANAGGLAHLIEAMGPDSLEDPLAFNLALWSHKSVSYFAFDTNNEVFLLRHNWVERFIAKSGTSLLDMTSYRVQRQLAMWATMRQFMEAYKQGYSNAATMLVRRTRSIIAELEEIEPIILYYLQGNHGITERPVLTNNSITTHTYHIDNDKLAQIIGIQAMLRIMTNRIKIFFATDGNADDHELCERQNSVMRERIWRLLDFAKHRKPLGHSFYPMCLIVSYESASAGRKSLILRHLNEFEVLGSEVWTDEKVTRRYLAATGRLITL